MPANPDAAAAAVLQAGAAELVRDDWRFWAHPAQLPPPTAWTAWVFLGGRGAGKTRAAAEWVRAQALAGRAERVALVGPSLHDVREVMIEGPSGLARIADPRPRFEASRRRLIWPNGALAYAFSAEDPDSLRGPEFDAAWIDEFCAWPAPQDVLAVLRLGLRLGARPQLVATTTPRPIAPLIGLIRSRGAALTQAATRTNARHLSDGFLQAAAAIWGAGAARRQELEGEIVRDRPDALWRRAEIAGWRIDPVPALEEIVVAIDPAATSGPHASACGIIAAGAFGQGGRRCAVVLADATAKGLAPLQWAERASALAESLGAQRIVAEANQGGEMVRAVLELVSGPVAPIRLVRAFADKRARAAPVAALYAQGRVRHAPGLEDLEEAMIGFGGASGAGELDRVDALVWALRELLLGPGGPSIRGI